MKKLDDNQIRDRLDALDGWDLDGNGIRKVFTFETFPKAIAFVNRVAGLAEAADHHPDIHVDFRTVTLILSTHSAGGLTGRDMDLAAQIG